MIEAKVIADSVSPDGVRLTTVEATSNRFILAEANTHRTWSRNSASSRAIPLAKQIKRIMEDLAVPSVFPKEQRGMQGGEPLDERDEREARRIWQEASEHAVDAARALGGKGVHKSIANRLLEPFMHHTMVITATAWQNFFEQRCSPLAQPEIRLMAEAIRDAMEKSEPHELDEGDWHLPYWDPQTDGASYDEWACRMFPHPDGIHAAWMPSMMEAGYSGIVDVVARVSAARCAQLSYLTQPVIDPETGGIVDPGGKVDIEKDLARYEKLTTADPPHWSPLEHVATPWPQNRQDDYRHGLNFTGLDGVNRYVNTGHLPRIGNLLAWRSLRTEVEVQQRKVTFR